MRRILILLTLLLAGCHFPSKIVLEGSGGRNAYNIEVQKTNLEEMLLNLVRLRYYDSPFFLDVSSITSQFTLKNLASASIHLPGFDKTNPMSLGGETQWQNQPTIQYAPLQGQEFAHQLMQPIDINIIQQIIYSGWDINRVFVMTVQNFQDLPNIPKEGLDADALQQHEKFHEIVHLMNTLQKKGHLQVGISQVERKEKKIDDIQFAFPADDEISVEIANLLNNEIQNDGKYILNVVVGFDEKGNIGRLPRSLLSCMYFLSKGVQIPKKDIEENKASCFKNSDNVGKFQDLLSVYSCNKKPKNAFVAIKYRDYWFYIKDNDLHSKQTFMLLLEIYNLQSGRVQDKGPILTLPLGIS
jgi:hypothetical protein